jgi:hypothetical protein
MPLKRIYSYLMMINRLIGSGFIYGTNLQDACSPVMREAVLFHDENLVVLIVIASLVGGRIAML